MNSNDIRNINIFDRSSRSIDIDVPFKSKDNKLEIVRQVEKKTCRPRLSIKSTNLSRHYVDRRVHSIQYYKTNNIVIKDQLYTRSRK